MASLAGEVHITAFVEPSEELKAFIAIEVRKALLEVLQEETVSNLAIRISQLGKDSTVELPDWARLG